CKGAAGAEPQSSTESRAPRRSLVRMIGYFRGAPSEKSTPLDVDRNASASHTRTDRQGRQYEEGNVPALGGPAGRVTSPTLAGCRIRAISQTVSTSASQNCESASPS